MHQLIDGREPPRRAGKISPKVIGCAGACVFVLLCLVCGACGAPFYYWYWKTEADKAAKEAERQRILDALTPELPSYLDPKNMKPGLTKGKFKGKVVCIDKDKKQIDADAQMALPDTLKATKPDEVGAVAWLNWSEEEGGDYPDGTKAKIYVVRVGLIDKRTGSVLIIGKEIRGDTEATKYGKGDRVGPKPYEKIAALLQEHADSN
jgi:hypothetical protein